MFVAWVAKKINVGLNSSVWLLWTASVFLLAQTYIKRHTFEPLALNCCFKTWSVLNNNHSVYLHCVFCKSSFYIIAGRVRACARVWMWTLTQGFMRTCAGMHVLNVEDKHQVILTNLGGNSIQKWYKNLRIANQYKPPQLKKMLNSNVNSMHSYELISEKSKNQFPCISSCNDNKDFLISDTH